MGAKDIGLAVSGLGLDEMRLGLRRYGPCSYERENLLFNGKKGFGKSLFLSVSSFHDLLHWRHFHSNITETLAGGTKQYV